MIYDITQPVFECEIYPGDPKPEGQLVCNMEEGSLYNLTTFSMCAHNGTHVDAPRHFIKDGKGIGQVSLDKFVGPAYVISKEGDLSAEDARVIVKQAAEAYPGAEKRILIKGKATVTLEAAKAFSETGIDLVGNESQTVGPENGPMAVHLVLLAEEVVLLEGIRLAAVPDGPYILNCAPLNLGSADGSPCRAILLSLK